MGTRGRSDRSFAGLRGSWHSCLHSTSDLTYSYSLDTTASFGDVDFLAVRCLSLVHISRTRASEVCFGAGCEAAHADDCLKDLEGSCVQP